MASKHPLGLWQQTSEQTVRQHQQPSYKTPPTTTFSAAATTATTVTVTKRKHDGSPAHALPPPAMRPASAATPLLSSRRQPARLQASAIVRVGADASEHEQEHSYKYAQQRVIGATPATAADPLLSLAHHRYGLPAPLVANLAALGIRSIYPWQKQCLLGPGLLDGTRSLVYAAPTGGGKSLVADILMLRQVLLRVGRGGGSAAEGTSRPGSRPKVLLVLPFVALVQEKVRWLRRIVAGLSRADCQQNSSSSSSSNDLPAWQRRLDEGAVRVIGFFGGAKIRATWDDFDIGVATIEKANALVNTAIDNGTISDLKVLVLDELHMIDDGHRGYLLELLATKLLCLEQHVQIVGMSATLTNMDLLARWLGARSYETHYRPVPVDEHIVYDGNIYAAADASARFLAAQANKDDERGPLQPLRTIQPSGHRELQDPVTNAVVALAEETARSGFSALVFSSSRAASESDAVLISRVMPAPDEIDAAVREARLHLLGDLRNVSSEVDSHLGQTVLAGVGFHHAGMTTEERDLVAGAYDAGVLKVCVATCGLAAGINLPARRVILHNARMGRDLVGPAMLRQMRGRAGRKGKDEMGETYLCCRRDDVDDVLDLMHAELPQVSSCLVEDTHRLQRALLEAIVVRLATSRESLDDYVRKTMLYHAHEGSRTSAESTESSLASLWTDVSASLEALQTMGFVTMDAYHNFEPTRLGTAVVASALDPEDAVFVHSELQRALQAFVLDGEMHVLYTFTPVHEVTGATINWRRFWEEMEGLDESGMRVLSLLGLKPSVISKMLRGGALKESTPEEKETARIYRRFYLALQLRDLCNEMPIHRVAQKYDTPRGAVQNLAQTCEGFAAGMIKFCEHMDWGAMASVLEHFVDRLKAGAKADLLALARIAFVKSRTARVFWENGFKTVAAVANADPNELVPILMQAQASKVRFEERNEQIFQEKLLAKAHIITESANRIWQLEMQNDLEE